MAHSFLTRRALLSAFAATTITASPLYADAPWYLRGAGDQRRLRFENPKTGESVDTVYWADGRYIPASLNAINSVFRDWRADTIEEIDVGVLDMLSATHRLLEVDEPYTLLSGFRTQATNQMLSRNINGVASKSYHVRAQAADVRLPSRNGQAIASAALSLNAGGVGRYPNNNFAHVDCGPVRTWVRA